MSAVRPFSEADVAGFGDTLRNAGFRLPGNPIMDGAWHRTPTEGDKGRKKSGSYRSFLNGTRPGGLFTNFRTGHTENWKSDAPVRAVSPAERKATQRAAAEANARRQRKQEARQETVARRCAIAWDGSPTAPEGHPYLVRKGIPPEGLRLDRRGRLRVPMRDIRTGRIVNLQTIANDGRKLFQRGGRVHGTHLLLGEVQPGGVLLIGEGFAAVLQGSTRRTQ